MAGSNEQSVAELVELAREIARAYQRLKLFSNRTGIFHDYGGTTAEILSLLYHFGDHSVAEVARIRSVSRQFVVKLARGLEEEGVVLLREGVAGKRGYVLSFTSEGRRMWEERQRQFTEAMGTLQADVTEDELRIACGVLRRIGTGY